MKNLIILVLSILLFYLKYLNCTLIGLGRREEGDKILNKTYFRTEETRKQRNHTILIKITNENPVTYIRFSPSTILTTSSVIYDGSLIKFVEFTAYNTTNFHINVTVYGYDRPPEIIKTKSSLYYELLKLDRMVDSKLSNNNNNNNNNNDNNNDNTNHKYNILSVHTNYNNDNVSDSSSASNGTDYDDSNMDELFNLIATMKLKNFNLSITNDRLIPIYNQYNEKLLINNSSNNSNNHTNSDGSNEIDPFFLQLSSFLLHTKQNYFDFWSNKNETTSAAPITRFIYKKYNYFILIYCLVLFMILL